MPNINTVTPPLKSQHYTTLQLDPVGYSKNPTNGPIKLQHLLYIRVMVIRVFTTHRQQCECYVSKWPPMLTKFCKSKWL